MERLKNEIASLNTIVLLRNDHLQKMKLRRIWHVRISAHIFTKEDIFLRPFYSFFVNGSDRQNKLVRLN